MNKNKIILGGTITNFPTFSHEGFKEKFYRFELCTTRKSDTHDKLICMAPESLISSDIVPGATLKVVGSVRTRDIDGTDGKRHLYIFVFVTEMLPYDGDKNVVKLDGYICKPPVYRETPRGRQITDVLLAVNRAYGKSDYIPCICWGSNAKRVADMEVSNHVHVKGRLQSREYTKRYEDGSEEVKVAYELSVSSIEEIDKILEEREEYEHE